MVANVDMAATILDAAGVVPSWSMEGRSVFDVQRTSMVLEGIGGVGYPGWCGVRQRNWLYVDWSGDGGIEMYDYVHDPYEVNNLAGDASFATKRAELASLTAKLCSPLPPGYLP
jgi:hypothetical protein